MFPRKLKIITVREMNRNEKADINLYYVYFNRIRVCGMPRLPFRFQRGKGPDIRCAECRIRCRPKTGIGRKAVAKPGFRRGIRRSIQAGLIFCQAAPDCRISTVRCIFPSVRAAPFGAAFFMQQIASHKNQIAFKWLSHRYFIIILSL